MPMLTPTGLYATIDYIGVNTDATDLTTVSEAAIKVGYEGFAGDSHSGLTRPSCVRVKSQYPKGTEIRNTRQISALSSEELQQIAEDMSLERIDPSWVGANLVLSGLSQFSQIPPSSRLIAENRTALVVDMENAPCRFPGDVIERHHPGKGQRFPRAAIGKRGVTLWVEHVGTLTVGDRLSLHIPPPCSWQPSGLTSQ